MQSCPLCQSKSCRTINSVMGNDSLKHSILLCNNCGHFFTGISKMGDPNLLYDEGDYEIRHTQKSIFFKIQYWEYRKVLNGLLGAGYKSASKFLDFGCGKGVFLHIAQKQGFNNLHGVETSAPRANYAIKNYGVDVSKEFYSNGILMYGEFDVITLFHVLEHLPQPISLLKELFLMNLKKNGMVVIEVPNYSSFQSKLSGNKWLHLDVPRHISHFTKEKLETCIEELDLIIVKKQTFSLHLGIIGMAQAILNLFGYKGFLIRDLKEGKRFIKLIILVLLPIALILEGISSIFNRGGIIRVYAKPKG